MKRSIYVLLLLLSLSFGGYANAQQFPIPNTSPYPAWVYPQFPGHINVPVYVNQNLLGSPSEWTQVLQYLNHSGSRYFFYYAGTLPTNFSACNPGLGFISNDSPIPTPYDFCGGGGFLVKVGNAVPNGTPRTTNSRERSFGEMLTTMTTINGGAGVLGPDAPDRNVAEGGTGLPLRPVVANKLLAGNLIPGPAVDSPGKNRTVGAQQISCVSVPTVDAYVCLEFTATGDVRVTRTSYTAPGSTSSACSTPTSVNCGLNLPIMQFDWFTPRMTFDTTRNTLWVAAAGYWLYSSADMGATWTYRGNTTSAGGYVSTISYNSFIDRLVMIIDAQAAAMTVLVAPPAQNPMFMSTGVLTSGGQSVGNDPQYVATGEGASLDCSKTITTGVRTGVLTRPLCTYIFNDATSARTIRRVRFVPHDGGATPSPTLLSNVLVAGPNGQGFSAAGGIAARSCSISSTKPDGCDYIYVLNNSFPSVGFPLSYTYIDGTSSWSNWANTRFPAPTSSVLEVPSGLEMVYRQADSSYYLISRRDVFEYY